MLVVLSKRGFRRPLQMEQPGNELVHQRWWELFGTASKTSLNRASQGILAGAASWMHFEFPHVTTTVQCHIVVLRNHAKLYHVFPECHALGAILVIRFSSSPCTRNQVASGHDRNTRFAGLQIARMSYENTIMREELLCLPSDPGLSPSYILLMLLLV